MSEIENKTLQNMNPVASSAAAKLTRMREVGAQEKLALSAPVKPEELQIQAVFGTFYEPKSAIQQVAALISLAVLSEISTKNQMKTSSQRLEAEVLYAVYSRLWCERRDPFNSSTFADEFVLPMFKGKMGTWFKLGALMSTTTIGKSKDPKIRDGKSIIALARRTQSTFNRLSGYFTKFVVDGHIPTGRTINDLLEVARRCAFMFGDGSEESQISKFDNEATITLADLDELEIEDSYMPAGWLAFVFFGPFGRSAFQTRLLPILANSALEMKVVRSSRKTRKKREAEESQAKSVAEYKAKIAELTNLVQLHERLDQRHQMGVLIQSLAKRIDLTTDPDQRTRLIAEYAVLYDEYSAAVRSVSPSAAAQETTANELETAPVSSSISSSDATRDVKPRIHRTRKEMEANLSIAEAAALRKKTKANVKAQDNQENQSQNE